MDYFNNKTDVDQSERVMLGRRSETRQKRERLLHCVVFDMMSVASQ